MGEQHPIEPEVQAVIKAWESGRFRFDPTQRAKPEQAKQWDAKSPRATAEIHRALAIVHGKWKPRPDPIRSRLKAYPQGLPPDLTRDFLEQLARDDFVDYLKRFRIPDEMHYEARQLVRVLEHS